MGSGSIVKIVAGAAVLAVTLGFGWLLGRAGVGQDVPVASLTELEREFAERMQQVVLVGNFTVDGRESGGASPERYEIASVAKVGDDTWRFDVRMVYGNFDAPFRSSSPSSGPATPRWSPSPTSASPGSTAPSPPACSSTRTATAARGSTPWSAASSAA